MAARVRRWLGITAVVLVVVPIGVATYVAVTWNKVYDAPLPQVQVSTGRRGARCSCYSLCSPCVVDLLRGHAIICAQLSVLEFVCVWDMCMSA